MDLFQQLKYKKFPLVFPWHVMYAATDSKQFRQTFFFWLCYGAAAITYLHWTVHPLRRPASDAKLVACCMMCNADETFWQMCSAVIGLKGPPASVCHCDESLESLFGGDAAGRLEESVSTREFPACDIWRLRIEDERMYSRGVGCCVLLSSHVNMEEVAGC